MAEHERHDGGDEAADRRALQDDDQDGDGAEGKPADDGKADKRTSGRESGDGDQSDEDAKHDEERNRAKPFVRVALVLFVLLLVSGGVYYWLTTRGKQTTDDAFTAGRLITIAPHVSGYVTELDVNDNEFVHQGQLLLRIDQRDYLAARDQSKASLDSAKSQVQSSKYGVEVAKQTFPAQLKQAQGALLMAQAQEFRAETDYRRQHSIERAATTQQDIDYSTAALDQAKAQVIEAQGQVAQATPVAPQISTQSTRVDQQSSALAEAQAELDRANLNLEWTTIRAPNDGWIAQRNIERGSYVTSGQALFSIVEPDVWITANFKETEITRMRAGQPVRISVDAYPDLHLSGHVDSIQLGAGSAFSAFPPENATGNFVKIVQRVPVKIVIDSGLDPLAPLPIGISVEPTVDIQ